MTETARFAAFVIVGGIAAAVNVLARIAFDLVLPFEAAVLAAFPVALTTAFILNRSFVFRSTSDSPLLQYGRFLTINLLALAQVWIVSVALARFIFPALGFAWHADTIAHVVGVTSPTLTSYFGHKHFSFGR